MNVLDLGKYRTIVISIVLFLVIDAGVLIMNFYMANRIAEDAVAVNLAGRQRTLSQQAVKSLLQTDNALGSGNYIDEPLEELRTTYRLFDTTLIAFRDSGTVVGADGEDTFVPAVTTETGRRIVAETLVAWQPLKEALQPVLRFGGSLDRNAELVLSGAGADLEGDLYHAILTDVENSISAELLRLSNDLTLHVESEAERRAVLLRIVQVSGICLALINFFVILFHFIRKLREYDADVENARRETDDILDTVTEGLFLLDENMRIGSQYSRSLERILRRDRLHGVNLFAILRDIVPENTLKVARDYVDLFFGDRVHENLINDLNPLDRVEVHFEDRRGGYQTRCLGFEFRRVLVEDTLSHLLVTVNDITDKVALEKALEEERENNQKQLDTLLDVLHIEPGVLNEFLSGAEHRITQINAVLQESGRHAAAHRAKLDAIARHVHALKGEAGAVGVTSLQTRAHAVEDLLGKLRDKPDLKGNDFLPLTIKLDEALRHIHAISQMIARLVDFRGAFSKQRRAPSRPVDPDAERRGHPRTSLADTLQNLARQIAQDEHKRVTLVTTGLDSPDLPEHFRRAVKDIAVQLIRNGVVHGIEAPDQRLAAEKAQEGRIVLRLTGDRDHGYELTYRDDGAGLGAEKIREVAVEKGFVTADQIEKMDERSVLSLIFRRGFSTCRRGNRNAGRGVGMDVIRSLVRELDGRVRLATSEGEYTSFQIRLPAESGSTRAA